MIVVIGLKGPIFNTWFQSKDETLSKIVFISSYDVYIIFGVPKMVKINFIVKRLHIFFLSSLWLEIWLRSWFAMAGTLCELQTTADKLFTCYNIRDERWSIIFRCTAEQTVLDMRYAMYDGNRLIYCLWKAYRFHLIKFWGLFSFFLFSVLVFVFLAILRFSADLFFFFYSGALKLIAQSNHHWRNKQKQM